LAVYVCANRKCLFTFERTGSVEVCPDCGHINVRYANDDEVEEYRKNREESGANYQKTKKSPARSQ